MNKRMPLAADKELFRLWYEFYRLALTSADADTMKAVKKSRAFYKEWNVDVTELFDPWWAKHRHLFEQKDFVKIIDSAADKADNSILIEIPLSKPRTEVLAEIRSLLPTLLPTRPRKMLVGSKYVPTEVQGVKRDSLRIMLDLERRIFRNDKLKGEKLRERVQKFFNEERYKRKKNKVPLSFYIDTYADTTDNVDRNIRRYRQKVRKLILNVASGEFPGKY